MCGQGSRAQIERWLGRIRGGLALSEGEDLTTTSECIQFRLGLADLDLGEPGDWGCGKWQQLLTKDFQKCGHGEVTKVTNEIAHQTSRLAGC